MVAIAVDSRSGLQRERRARASASRHRAVIVRRYRLAAACALLGAAGALWAQAGVAARPGGGPLAASGAGATQAVSAHVWIVQPGDTIWGIARQIQPSGDTRPLVDSLEAQVHGRPLEVGRRLVLP